MKKHNLSITTLLALVATMLPGILNAMEEERPCPFPTHLWGNVTLSSTHKRSRLGRPQEMPAADTMSMRIEHVQSTYNSCRQHVSPAEYRQIGLYLAMLKRANERIQLEQPGISPTAPLNPMQQSATEQQSARKLLCRCMQAIEARTQHYGTDKTKITEPNTRPLRRTTSSCALDDEEEYPLGWC